MGKLKSRVVKRAFLGSRLGLVLDASSPPLKLLEALLEIGGKDSHVRLYLGLYWVRAIATARGLLPKGMRPSRDRCTGVRVGVDHSGAFFLNNVTVYIYLWSHGDLRAKRLWRFKPFDWLLGPLKIDCQLAYTQATLINDRRSVVKVSTTARTRPRWGRTVSSCIAEVWGEGDELLGTVSVPRKLDPINYAVDYYEAAEVKAGSTTKSQIGVTQEAWAKRL